MKKRNINFTYLALWLLALWFQVQPLFGALLPIRPLTLGPLLGSGATANVYLLPSSGDEPFQTVAKIAKENFADDLAHEYKLFMQMPEQIRSHPNMVQYRSMAYKSCSPGERSPLFLEIEHMPQRSIEDYLAGQNPGVQNIAFRPRRFETCHIFKIVSDILAPLELMHLEGWAHLDLKTENIGLVITQNPDGTFQVKAKLMDFGQLRMLNSKAAPGASIAQTPIRNYRSDAHDIGTVWLNSTLQRQRKRLNIATDLHQVSLILLELIASRYQGVPRPHEAHHPYLKEQRALDIAHYFPHSLKPEQKFNILRGLFHFLYEKDSKIRNGDTAQKIYEDLKPIMEKIADHCRRNPPKALMKDPPASR